MSIEDDWTLFRMQGMKPERFEQLCSALLTAQGHTDVRHWGAAGSEGGVDILSVDAEGKRWVTQCKRTTSFSPSKAKPELQKVLDKPPSPLPDFYRLAAPCNISRKTEEALEELVEASTSCSGLQIAGSWTATTLVEFLRDQYTDLHEKFIGKVESLPFWNVPRGTDFFTGREEILEELEQRLEKAGSASLTQTIVGLGGIGKTQTAIEYCRRNRARYPAGIFWVDASSAVSLMEGYAKCAHDLVLDGDRLSTEEAAEIFIRHLERFSGWFVVLDNADTPKEIRSLLPPNVHGQTLITTRDQAPGLGRREPIRLDCLPIRQATDFLLERTGRPETIRKDAEILAEALEGLPLALEQAGAYLAEVSTLSLQTYREKLAKLSLDYLEGHEPSEGGYGLKTGHRTVAATWEISFRALEESAPAAAEVLNACAFLHPEAIPVRLFQEAAAYLGAHLHSLRDELRDDSETVHSEILRPLRKYSLVDWEPGAEPNRGQGVLSVHRLVQAVARWRLGDSSSKVLDGVYRALSHLFPTEYQSPSTWVEGAFLFPQVQASAEHWSENNGSEPTVLWAFAGSNAWASGRRLQARVIQAMDLEVSRRVLGEEHPSTLTSMSNLANTLRDLGDAAGAREIHEKSLEVRQRVLGEEHPDTLTSMNNLAETFWILGDTAGARELHEKALEVRRRVLGEEHPSTLTSMNNLAETLRELGNAAGVRELHEKALEVRQRVLGEEHPDTLASMNNLANTLRDLGDAKEARELHEKALEVSRRVLGEEHPSTLAVMSNLASTCRDLGDAPGARELHEKALEVRQRVLGEEHPDTLASMNNLASILWDLGDAAEARKILANALEVSRRVLGEKHPSTLTAMNNLAHVLKEFRELEGAEALFTEAYEGRRKVLGESHPQTTSVHQSLRTLKGRGGWRPFSYLMNFLKKP